MKGRKYDMEKLEASGKMDVSVCSRFYYTQQDFFDELTNFIENHNTGFSNYTPAFVVNSEEDRKEFLNECFEARAQLTRIGMTALLDELSVMEDAAIHRNMKEFADGQIKYGATMEICLKLVKDSARRWVMSR